MSGDTRSARSAKALQYANTALKGAAGVAALSPFPQVKIIFQMAHSIVEMLQNTDTVETVFANLAAQVCRSLRFIADTLRDKDVHTAKRLAGDLKDLRDVIKSIRQLVETQQARNYFERLFSARTDAAQARDCSKQLKSALEFFSLRSTVQIRASIHSLQGVIDDLREDVAALKIPPALGPSTTSLQVVKHARRKSDVGSKSNDSCKADQKGSTKLAGTLVAPSFEPNIRRSKSMVDVKVMSDGSSDRSKMKAKADKSKSQKQKSTRTEDIVSPSSSKATTKTGEKPKTDKTNKPKSPSAEKCDKASTGTASKSNKNARALADEGHAQPKDERKGTPRPRGADKQKKDTTHGKENSNKEKKPQASINSPDQSTTTPTAKPSSKPKDTSNSKSSKTPSNAPDKNKAETPKSQIRTDNPIAAQLNRSQSDSPNKKLCHPNESLKRANSTGNLDKKRKSKGRSTSKTSKALDGESTPGVRTNKPQASDTRELSAPSRSERSPSPALSDNKHDEQHDENNLIPVGKTKQGRQRCVSEESRGNKPANKNKAGDDTASSSAPRTLESATFVFLVSPPSSW